MNAARFLIALAATLPLACMAGIETDRDAGTCAALMSASRRMDGAERALSMADNVNRAGQFAKTWFQEIRQLSGKAKDGALIQAAFACERIGVRYSDYRK